MLYERSENTFVKQIRVWPDGILGQKTEYVKPEHIRNGEISQLIAQLHNTLDAVGGLGLAAPQIGVSLAVAIARAGSGPEYVLVNPELEPRGRVIVSEEEGCLSLPTIRLNVPRFEKVLCRYFDDKGAAREIEAEGLLAIELQHEYDHLQGRLIISSAGAMAKDIARRKIAQWKKHNPTYPRR